MRKLPIELTPDSEGLHNALIGVRQDHLPNSAGLYNCRDNSTSQGSELHEPQPFQRSLSGEQQGRYGSHPR